MRFMKIALMAATALVSVSAAAGEMSLDGAWESRFQDSDTPPGADAEWNSIQVPSLVGRVEGKPFLWYRRSFELPAKSAGGRLFLRIGASRFVTTVFVNGREVGGHRDGWTPFDVEITAAVRSDGPNQLLVRVQDVTGVIAEKLSGERPPRGVRYIDRADDSVMAPVGSRYAEVGIWQPVTILSRNDVFLDDVFVKTSVRQGAIEVDYTLRNLAARPKTVALAARVAETDIGLREPAVTVPADSSSTVTLRSSWPKPRQWGPEDPHLYTLVTTLTEQGGPKDEQRTRFGFREFWTEGDKLILNGTPINFLATAGHPRGSLAGELSKPAAVDFYRRIRETGCVGMRLHANIWPKCWYEAADEVGMPLILESALFCWARAYALSKDEFWKNYHDHLRAILKDHRNHPSIVMISLENEILHCGGDRVPETEHRLAEAGRFVKRLDPTRPILYDGDGDPEGVADVVNLHYPLDFNQRNLWPGAGYWLETGMEVSGWPHKFFQWDRKKPLYFGEFLHLQHFRETDPYSVVLGDGAYQGHHEAMARAKAAAWEMQVRAYRACGVSGMCPWTLTETGAFPSDDNPRYLAVQRAYQPNAAFVREYDSRFFAGEQVVRTVDVFNDTLHPATLTLDWKLTGADSGQERFDLPPAGRREVRILLEMPEVKRPAPVRLSLAVHRDGERVFDDELHYGLFPRRPLDLLEGIRIALFETGDGPLGRALSNAGATLVRLESLAEIPSADVLLIGPHALDAVKPEDGPPVVGGRNGPRLAISAFVRDGGSVVVLEQDTYEHGLLPARLVQRGASIAFQRTRAELFDDLPEDVFGEPFRFWRGDHVVARKTIAKPSHGRFRTLIDSGGPDGLVYVALMEVLEGRGRYLLSQLAIGEKLDSEPAARLTLERLLRHAASRPEPAVALAVVQDKLPLTERLRDVDATFSNLSGRLGEIELEGFGVLLAETDCDEVARNLAKIRRYVEGGGRVVLHGGTPEAFGRLQELFPEPIFAQRTTSLPIGIAEPDCVIDGLSNQELHWYGDRDGLSWRERTPLSSAVAHYAITAGQPDPGQCVVVEAESMTGIGGEPRFEAESVYMWRTGSVEKTVEFPKTGYYTFGIRGRGTPCAGVYPRVELSIDGRSCGGVSTESEDWGTYYVAASVPEGEHTLSLAFVNDASNPETGEDRNVRLDRVVYGPTPPLASKRLLEPAVLVKVPLGQGFLLVDQVRWAEDDSNPEKASRYLSNLLVNLGCPFGTRSGGITIAAASMEPQGDFRFTRGSDGAAYLGSNGTILGRVRFAEAGKYEFVIRASGTEAGGELPKIRVGLDGESIGEVQLEKPGWQPLRLQASLAEGEHEISLSFTNDYYDPPADRNLRIQSLMIRPVPVE